MGEGRVVSVNVGRPQPVQIGSRMRMTGIFKEPQEGRVRIAGEAVGDDVQVDRKYHGGTYQAVYAYAAEDYRWWEEELGIELTPGIFGENITTSGMDITNALIGERWRVGEAVLEITDPRIPCSTFRARMGIRGFIKRFAAERRFGAYFMIVEEGHVGVGDQVSVLYRPEHDVTIARMGAVLLSGNVDEAETIFEKLGQPQRREQWIHKLRRKAG
jgi:MOSC domain-containing protein YiiM